jgi:hypothetical protein
MATPTSTTFQEYYEQVMTSDQDPGKKEFRTLYRKSLTQISLLEEQIADLTARVNRTEGERDESRLARKDTLNAVARVVSGSTTSPRKALHGPSSSSNPSGIKKPCTFFPKGLCNKGDTCTFSHISTVTE